MVRYRYGPWDHRYRRFLNVLAGLGLVHIDSEKRTIIMRLTEDGLRAADRLARDPAYETITARAALLKKHFNIGPTNLMEFIYRTFPEVVSLNLGDKIAP